MNNAQALFLSTGEAARPGTPRGIVLCADDFGLSEGVSNGILALAQRGRLSAVSCMSLGAAWRGTAAALADVDGRCDIGLHLTLTDHRPLTAMPRLAGDGRLPSVGGLIGQAFAGRLDRSEVDAELQRQLEAFIAVRGRAPDFLDGHQHIHLLPVVRDVVVDLLRRPELRHAYVRVCREPVAAVLGRRIARGKTLFLSALSGGLVRAVRLHGLSANDSFRGVHGFDPAADVQALFRRFLDGDGRRPLIMCHPGFVDDQLRAIDPLTEARRREYDYFTSDAFADDLATAARALVRFCDLPAA